MFRIYSDAKDTRVFERKGTATEVAWAPCMACNSWLIQSVRSAYGPQKGYGVRKLAGGKTKKKYVCGDCLDHTVGFSEEDLVKVAGKDADKQLAEFRATAVKRNFFKQLTAFPAGFLERKAKDEAKAKAKAKDIGGGSGGSGGWGGSSGAAAAAGGWGAAAGSGGWGGSSGAAAAAGGWGAAAGSDWGAKPATVDGAAAASGWGPWQQLERKY
jgi:hypothetical protein